MPNPTITASVQPGAGPSKDTFVSSLNPTTSYYANSYLHVGNHETLGMTRAFIKFNNLPSLQPFAKIINAYLEVYMYLAVGSDSTVIEAHQITSDWQSSTTTWNVQPTYRSTPESSIASSANGWWQFDITSLVQRWYSLDQDLYGASSNYGVMLKAANEMTPRRSFYSGDYTIDLTEDPKLVITYEVDPIGLEDFWKYDNNVNVYNGNYVLSEADVTLPGRGVPITVTRAYNSRAFSPAAYPYGYGWTLDVARHINYTDDGAITYTTEDGNKYVFVKNTSGNYDSPAGVSLVFAKESGIYVITDPSGIKYYFNNNGKLYNTVDTSNNITTISYNANGTINTITDPSGRLVSFNYTNGKLTSITGAQIPTVQYSYQNSVDLISAVIQDTSNNVLWQESYGYDANHNLTSITDGDGNVTTINYSSDQVQSITKNLTINGVLNSLVTSYSYQVVSDTVVTQVTDPRNIVTQYTCQNTGSPIKIIMDYGTGKLNLTSENSWNDNLAMEEETYPQQVIDGQTGNQYKYLDQEENPASKFSVTRATTPANIYANNYQYTAQNDVMQSMDRSGAPTNYTYDQFRNNFSLNNSYSYAQSIDYDSYGDITRQTVNLGIQSNLLQNTSFERWASGLPTQWSKVSSGGTISADTTTKVNGFNSVKLIATGSSSTTVAQLATTDYFSILGNFKYNISWYVRTQNVGSTNGGATVRVDWYTAAHAFISSSDNIDPTIGTIDWIRRGARIDAPASAAYAKAVITLNDAGTAWYDDIQMEAGTAINQYNLTNNSSFESVTVINNKETPDFWSIGALGSTDGIDDTQSHTGSRSLLVHGVAGINRYFHYDTQISGLAGDEIYFSGWSKFQGTSVGGYYGLLLYVKYTDNTEDWIPALFNNPNGSWDFTEGEFTTAKDYSYFAIYGKFENQTGQAWFDDFTLRYAAAGNALISKYNILQNDSFEIADNTGNWPDFWAAFHDTVSGTYDISWISSDPDDGLVAFKENKMIRISNVPSWAVVINNIFEPLQTGKTYTAYAAIKTVSVTGTGAVINIDILDSSGVYLSQKSSKVLKGTNDWTIVSVSLSEAEAKQINSNASQLRVSIGTDSTTSGTMYFDMVRLIDERAEITYEYTGNYITAVTDQLGNKTLMTRDIRGNITAQTDPKGYTSNMETDLKDQLTAVVNPLGLRTEYEYDKNGNVTQIVNKNTNNNTTLNTSTFVFNELGLVKSETDPLNRTTSFEYDKNGNVTEIYAPNGKDILYTNYDNSNRLKNVSYIGDPTTWAYNYDGNDNLTSVTKNSNAQTQFTYDEIDRLTSVTYPSNGGITNTTEYNYIPVDKLLSIVHSPVSTSMPSVEYVYDKNNMLVNVTDNNNGSADFMHDTDGRLRKSFYNSGYLNYRFYNSKGQITGVHTKNATGTPLVDTVYEFDPNGNIIRETFIDNSYVIYEYDQANQLALETYADSAGGFVREISYRYDSQYGGLLGNRTERTLVEGGTVTTVDYQYDAANQLTVSSVGSYTYDANGNLTQGSRNYAYNAENQLIQIADGSVVAAQYEYNHEGLRSKKIAGSLTEYYYYDNGNLAYITDASNSLKYYFTRDDQGRLINMIDWTATPRKTYWYILDARDSVIGMVDNTGQFVINYTYSAFGEILSSSGTATTGDGSLLRDANPFRYASYQFDTESGFYYLKSRYYLPFMGRFLTKDNARSNNRYVYCKNNPVTNVDPEGKSAAAIALSSSEFASFVAWLSTIGAANIWDPIGWIILGVIAVGGVTWAAISLYNKYKENQIAQVSKKIPNKLKTSDGRVDLSKFTNRNGPKQPKGGRSILGPLGYQIVKDIDQHKGVWKLLDWAGNRIATLAGDGTILGK